LHIKTVVDPFHVHGQLEFHRIDPFAGLGGGQRITNGFEIGSSEVFIQIVLGRV